MRLLGALPVSYFIQEDFCLMMKCAHNVLDLNEPDTKSSRSISKNEHAGRAEVLSSYGVDRMPCKRLRVFDEATNVTGEAAYAVCKYARKV